MSDGLTVARAVEGPVGAWLAKAGGVSNQAAAASGSARLAEVRAVEFRVSSARDQLHSSRYFCRAPIPPLMRIMLSLNEVERFYLPFLTRPAALAPPISPLARMSHG